jgi:hypothetical protein
MAVIVVIVVAVWASDGVQAWWRWVKAGRKVDMPEGPNYGKTNDN